MIPDTSEPDASTTPAAVPPDLLEAVSEAVFDWAGENGDGGGRPFWDAATKLVLEVLAENAQIVPLTGPSADEITKLRNACKLMGRSITGLSRAMEAARIEMAQGSAEKAMQWILNSLPDVSDDAPEDQWNGTETANEWFDRTREGAS